MKYLKQIAYFASVSSQAVTVEKQGSVVESTQSKAGISRVVCGGKLVVMTKPANDEDGGFQPFNGRLGKLRYLALAIMTAAGTVSASLVQLVLEFPVKSQFRELPVMSAIPDRAPVVYPLVFGVVSPHFPSNPTITAHSRSCCWCFGKRYAVVNRLCKCVVHVRRFYE